MQLDLLVKYSNIDFIVILIKLFNLGNLTIKDCEKFRKKRDAEKELLEIQSNIVDVKG
jgi:hypothetical protein